MEQRLPNQIIDSLLERKCLFFIGAGVSTEAGLPSTQEIVEHLIGKLQANGYKPSGSSLPEIAEEFSLRFSRPDLIKVVRDKIIERLANADRTTFKLLDHLLVKPKDIVTTNWDPLIEETLGRENYCPIFEPSAVANYSETKINLFKIHGDIDHDIVITKEDYQTYSEKWKPVIRELQALFQKRTVVFIGYSVKDEDFLEMYLPVLKELGDKYLLPRYCVGPDIDDLRMERLNKISIKVIKMTAKEFLERLNEQLEHHVVEEGYPLPSPKTVPTPPKEDNNPFAIFRAEDSPSAKWINETFIEPVDFAEIQKPGNAVIEGHRGSGKSVILRYLSLPCALERTDPPDYIGFYIKLQNSYIETRAVKRDKSISKEDWKSFFLHYFNLIVGESVLITLRDLSREGKIKIIDEKHFVKRVLFRYFHHLEGSLNDIIDINSLLDLFIRERNKCGSKFSLDYVFLSPHFIYDFVDLLRDHVEGWRDKFFYMLIDEYDKLDSEQQRVINLYLADRGTALRYKVSFKVAVKLFEMNYTTFDGRVLDHKDDYTWVPLDRFDKDKGKQFKLKLKDIANARLKYYGYKNKSIEEIFPSANKGFEEGDYSGIDNLLTLSSFLIRDFLELAKDILYYAFPWIVSEKREKIPPVPPHIQNTVIKIHANILYTRTRRESGRINGKDRKYIDSLLIDKLGLIFRRILEGSTSKEKRTVSSFQLRNQHNLSEVAKAALDDCRKIGALQVPYMLRAPQNFSRHAPHELYEFHRLLCPKFRLSLVRRWPREIDSIIFNKIFEHPDEAVNEITDYFLRNMLVEEINQITEAQELKKIYRRVCEGAASERELFGKRGEVKMERTLMGFQLKMGKHAIDCKNEMEARYLKPFAELGMRRIKVPKDLTFLSKIVPDIECIIPRINAYIRKKLKEFPGLKEEKAFSQIWESLIGEGK
ncbi:MAG TPA: hypothetical protein ENG66_02285 [Thermococcus sp.]|nr:hypothetical protein [Thermococcus sp.]